MSGAAASQITHVQGPDTEQTTSTFRASASTCVRDVFSMHVVFGIDFGKRRQP